MKRVLELTSLTAQSVFWMTIGNTVKSMLHVILIWSVMCGLANASIPFKYAFLTCVIIAVADALFETAKLLAARR